MSFAARLRTVRARLTLWYTAVFGGLLLLLGGTAFVLLDRGLRTNLDDSLASVARAVAASSEAGPADLADTLQSLLGPEAAERFFQLLDPFGRPDPRFAPRGRWTFPLSRSALRNGEEGRETFESIRLPGASGGDVRLLTFPVIEGGRVVHFVQVAASLDRIDQARSPARSEMPGRHVQQDASSLASFLAGHHLGSGDRLITIPDFDVPGRIRIGHRMPPEVRLY